jgi:N-acetylmuramoyl-L-alanine amidase
VKVKFPSRFFLETVGRRHCLPCLGLIVFISCGLSVLAPDSYFTPQLAAKKIENASASTPEFPLRETVNALPTVVIDPGHGGNDEGCRGHGLMEKNLTLDIAIRVEQMLRSFNVPVVLTRRDDRYVALSERAAIANVIDRAVFISIHFNQSRGPADGIETFYADQKIPREFAWTWIGLFGVPATSAPDNGETLAGYIQTSLVTKMDTRNRGIKNRDLYVVRHVNSPAVLVEAGFLSNTLEAQLLNNADYRERLAAGITEGLLAYIHSQHPNKPPTELATAKD